MNARMGLTGTGNASAGGLPYATGEFAVVVVDSFQFISVTERLLVQYFVWGCLQTLFFLVQRWMSRSRRRKGVAVGIHTEARLSGLGAIHQFCICPAL